MMPRITVRRMVSKSALFVLAAAGVILLVACGGDVGSTTTPLSSPSQGLTATPGLSSTPTPKPISTLTPTPRGASTPSSTATSVPTLTPVPTPRFIPAPTPTPVRTVLLQPIPTAIPAPPESPHVVFPAVQIAEETILVLKNRRQIVNEFTKGVLDGQIQEGSVTSLVATTGGRSDLIDIWFQEGLLTGDGFRIGITSSFQQLGEVTVREIKGNLFVVLKEAPPRLTSQGATNTGRARLATLGPVSQSFRQVDLRIAFATGDRPWDQPSPILKQTPMKLSSQRAAGPKQAGQRLQTLGQSDAGIAFGTGEPLGGQLIVLGDQVTLVDNTGSTLARFKFKGRNMEEAVQDVLASDVAPPDEEAIALGCGEGALSIVNVNLFSALHDFTQETTSGSQTTSNMGIADFIASKSEVYDCQTKEYSSELLISFAVEEGDTGNQGIAVNISPSSPRSTLTPEATPTLIPTPAPSPTLAPTPTPTPTLTPTPTPTPTATLTPTVTPMPTPTPQPGSVMIQAASCTFVSRSEFPNGVDEEFDVPIFVTVTGPVGTTFAVTRVHTATAQLGFSEYTSSWTGGFNTGRRELGDPEANTWNESLRVHTFNEPGQERSGTILFTATVTDSYGNTETSQVVTCPWQ